jgi:hypothetical protein
MSGTRWFASPLAGTAGVLAGLGLLSIPLRKLTSAEPVPSVQAAPATAAAHELPAVLRLRLLVPASRVNVLDEQGKMLLDLSETPAGESEHDVRIPFEAGRMELTLQAEFSGEAETALFLTVMPDGYEDQTRYTIGTGALEETLHFEWHVH